MRTWAKGAKPAALLALGVMALTGGGPAFADTDGDHSIGGGNQVSLPVTLPVDISGNAVGILGGAKARSHGGAIVKGDPAADAGGNRTSGRGSILGGNQVVAPITAPVNVCGNAISVFGGSDAACKGGAAVKSGGKGRAGSGAGGNRTSGRGSILGGNQVVAPVTAPVNVCGTAVAVAGGAKAGCKGGAAVKSGGKGRAGSGAGGNRTSGRGSILGGNQVVAPVTAPVNVCGTAVAVAGGAKAGCKGGAKVVGRAGKGAGGNRTSGAGSILGGNQVVAPVTAPVNVCGNAVAVLGKAFAGCKGGAKVVGGSGSGAGGNRTSGRGSILGGNQIVAPITAPVNVCGNAVAILGDAAAGCLGSAKVVSSSHHHGPVKPYRAGLLSAAPLAPAKKASHPVKPGRPKLPKASAHKVVPVPGGVPQIPGQLATLPGGLTELPNLPLVSTLPVKAPAADILPIKLVSAEETTTTKPAGMDAGAFLTMALGALFAATTAFFTFTRRFRLGRK